MGLTQTLHTMTPGAAARWDAFVADHPRGTLYHSSRWVKFTAEAFGFGAAWIMQETDGGELTGVLPLVCQRSRLFGDRWVSLPYLNYGGPLAADTDADRPLMEAAVALARRTRVKMLEIRDTALRLDYAVRTDKTALVLQLPATVDELLDRLGAKLRSQIRRADRERPEVFEGGAELIADFYRVFAETMRDLGTPVYPRRFFELMFDRVGADCRIVIVRLAGEPAAAAVLTHGRDTVEIPWAGSLRRFRPAAVNMRLYWECLRHAVESRGLRFDFGRSTIGSGTYRFKQQWGADPVPLYWYYPLAPAGPMAQARQGRLITSARAVWRRLPVSLATRLAAGFSGGLPW